MDATAAVEFARSNHRAVLVTLGRDGRPQFSPVTVGADAEDRLVVSTRETAVKTRNLRRDPRGWMCLLNDGFFGAWLSVEGRVDIVSLPEAMEGLVDYYRTISGEHPDWDEYRAAMRDQRRVLLRITPVRVGPDVHG